MTYIQDLYVKLGRRKCPEAVNGCASTKSQIIVTDGRSYWFCSKLLITPDFVLLIKSCFNMKPQRGSVSVEKTQICLRRRIQQESYGYICKRLASHFMQNLENIRLYFRKSCSNIPLKEIRQTIPCNQIFNGYSHVNFILR